MPIYVYKDPETDFTKEVMHSIAECDNPSPATTLEITYQSRTMCRVPSGGHYNEFSSMSPERKKRMLQSRADADFKKNIAPRKEQILKDAYGR